MIKISVFILVFSTALIVFFAYLIPKTKTSTQEIDGVKLSDNINEPVVQNDTKSGDYSSIVIKVPTPAEIFLTDDKGRQTGRIEGGSIVEEIPNSTYYLSEFIVPPGSKTVPSPNEGINTLYIRIPEKGRYYLKLLKPDNFTHTYDIYATGPKGESRTDYYTEDIVFDYMGVEPIYTLVEEVR